MAEEPGFHERAVVAQRIEREMSVLFGRARSISLSLASQVHPELDSASYALLLRCDAQRYSPNSTRHRKRHDTQPEPGYRTTTVFRDGNHSS